MVSSRATGTVADPSSIGRAVQQHPDEETYGAESINSFEERDAEWAQGGACGREDVEYKLHTFQGVEKLSTRLRRYKLSRVSRV